MIAPLAEKGAHPLAAFGLDMLARGAARLRGGRMAISEAGPGSSATELNYRELDELVIGFAARAGECGLAPGDRVVVVGASRIGTVAAMLGALGAGLEPVIAPAHISTDSLAFLAQGSGASAIFSPTLYGGLDMETLLFEAAAAAPEVRIVGSLGPGVADGAIDFSPRALGGAPPPPRNVRRNDPPRIGLVLRPGDKAPRATFVTQSALVAQALDVVTELGLAADRPIVSTLSPASAAGLVAGPIAALLAGAPLALFGPFDAAGLVVLADRTKPGCLVAPAAAGEDFIAAGLGDGLECLALAGAASFAPAAPPCRVAWIRTDADGRVHVPGEPRQARIAS